MVEDYDPIENDRIIFTKAKKGVPPSKQRNAPKNDSYQNFLNQDIGTSSNDDYKFL